MPLFFLVPEITPTSKPLSEAVRAGCKELYSTLKKLPQEKNILLYLISHMIYTDGLNTLFAFGGIYAAGTYGLTFEQVLMFGITMNITAGIGAMLLGWVDDYLGSKLTVIVSLICLTIFGIPLLFLHDKYIFWGVALVLCLFVGPVQSASRSLMVRLIAEKNMSAEMFGLYSLSGKITAFIGPWLLGMMTMTFASQRFGMATVLVFFVVGAVLLIPVKVKQDVLHQG
jgi:UMF1 family MFS transporter